jgi:homoserine dehydrogenase
MRIVIVGFGVVGQGFAKILTVRAGDLMKIYGIRPRVVAIVDALGAAENPKGLDLEKALLTVREKGTVSADKIYGKPKKSAIEVIENTDAEVMVEVTPTNIKNGEPGMSHIKTALKNKRHVITTNKGPLALALPALMELAEYNRVHLRFSGTVGGGTPVLDFAKKCLMGDKIESIRGILNGTTNYILTQMTQRHVPFEDALAEAQKKGYAEANPSMDVDGFDSACKIVILANWIMNMKATLRDVTIKGIREVTLKDIEEAEKKDCEIKLIGYVKDKLDVSPQLIPKTHPICVSGVLNAVTFTSQYAGEETIVGRGAGGIETASAILRDLIEIKWAIMRHEYPFHSFLT